MDRNTIPESTILQRKKRNVKISDQETLMLLRAYIVHPCSWDNVIKSIKDNSHTLPKEARELYENSTRRQLKDRLCTKLEKLMVLQPDSIKHKEIQEELTLVRQLEKKHVDAKQNTETPAKKFSGDDDKPTKKSPDDDKTERAKNSPDDDDKPIPSTSRSDTFREEAALALSNEDSDRGTSSVKRKTDIPAHSLSGLSTKKSKKKTPVMQLVRKNQLAYDKFITKKVPKSLRALGVSSSSDSE